MNEEYDDGALQFDKIHQSLSVIRRESLDIYNRLHSIDEDITFVEQVREALRDLPILPNLRCGAWYTNPAISTALPAYFKSTDGHFGNWSFNLRRANLHLFPLINENFGLILVDSTRSGKRIPDALSKTIPIWCAVLNRAIILRYPEIQQGDPLNQWDTSLYTPPGAVSVQEHDQIKDRLDYWADALAASSFDLPKLSRPLRPFWITPSTSTFPSFPDIKPFIPIVCVSASKQVEQGTERRSSGFSYIQGSGDDHELWGMGLTPHLFWQHRVQLLNADRRQLPLLITSLVSSHSSSSTENHNQPTPIERIGNRLSICTLADLPRVTDSHDDQLHKVAYILLCNDNPTVQQPSHTLCIQILEGKKSQHYFLQVLPHTTQFIGSHLSNGFDICVACKSGKDYSVGVVLAAITRFFDDKGEFVAEEVRRKSPNKQTIRTRLEWIISSRPEANPSRSTLKRVNEFLLSSPSFLTPPTMK